MRNGIQAWEVGLAIASMMGGVLPVGAELPMLEGDARWLGYFVGFENKHYSFGMTTDGKTLLRPSGKDGKSVGQQLSVGIDYLVEEILPDGKIQIRNMVPKSLESEQPATSDPRNLVLHGKAASGVTFELRINEEKGVISLAGKVLDPGKLTNPLRFAVRLRFPNAYPSAKRNPDKRELKTFETKIKDDRLQLTWTGGKRLRQSTSEPVDLEVKDLNGPGIESLQLEFSSWQEQRMQLTASQVSAMRLSNSKSGPRPLHEGFLATWSMDPTKDPNAMASLRIEMR